MGAMASKKASSVSPVSVWMAADSAGEVSGPVATMTLSHSAGGRPATSPRSMAIRRMLAEPPRHLGREMIAVDRQRPAGRELVGIAGGHDQRARAPHLLVQQAHRVGLGIVGAERVGADELGEPVRLVRLGLPQGPHLVQHHGACRRRAICHAASLPASPPPTMWMGWGMGRNLGANDRRLNGASGSTPSPAAKAAPSVDCVLATIWATLQELIVGGEGRHPHLDAPSDLDRRRARNAEV